MKNYFRENFKNFNKKIEIFPKGNFEFPLEIFGNFGNFEEKNRKYFFHFQNYFS